MCAYSHTKKKNSQRMGNRINSQTLHHLPHELMEEILTNLPVKSLLRFKCVSKPWRSLISGKSFTKYHLKKSSHLSHHNLIYSYYNLSWSSFQPIYHGLRSFSLTCLIDEQDYEDYSVITTSNLHPPMGIRGLEIKILGSCNGLILILVRWERLFLWNPSTRKVKNITPKRSSLRSRVYGLGYDDSTDDYKVVCIVTSPKPYQTEIYSLRHDSWKKIANFEKGFPKGISGKFVNGKLHWRVVEDGGVWDIVSLSMVDEKYEIVARPQHVSDNDYSQSTLNDLRGYLSLLAIDSKFDLNVWVMMRYGVRESWTKVWTFSDYSAPMKDIDARPLWFGENGDFALIYDKSTIVVYNGKNKLSKYHRYALHTTLVVELDIYVESLVSPL